MRRRSGAVAWAMLPVLAVAWLNRATACVGSPADDAHVALGGAVSTPHDHALRDPSDGLADEVVHSHSHAHGGSDDSATPHVMPLHDHDTCPHCPTLPTTGEPDPGHVVCNVSDDAAATPTANMAAQWDLKLFLSPIAWIAPLTAASQVSMRFASAQPAGPPPRSLNVRYCVLLL